MMKNIKAVFVLIILVIALLTFLLLIKKPDKEFYNFIQQYDDAIKENFNEKEELDSYLNPVIFTADVGYYNTIASKIFASAKKIDISNDRGAMFFPHKCEDAGYRLSYSLIPDQHDIYSFLLSDNKRKLVSQIILNVNNDRVIVSIARPWDKSKNSTRKFIYRPENSSSTFKILYLDEYLFIFDEENMVYQEKNKNYLNRHITGIKYRFQGKRGKDIALKYADIEEKHERNLRRRLHRKLLYGEDYLYIHNRLKWNKYYYNNDIKDERISSKYLRRLHRWNATRPSIYFKANSSLIYSVHVPSEPILEYALGFTSAEYAKTENFMFRIKIKDNKEWKTFKEINLLEYKKILGGFNIFSENLAEYANMDIELKFEFIAINDKNNKRAVLSFSSPMLYSKRKQEEKNIILISLDTLSAKHLEMYGYPRDTAPFFKEFAEENTIFLNSTSCSNWTMPSHMSMFSSMYPMETGFVRGRPPSLGIDFDISIKTVTQHLRDQGYITLGVHEGGFVSSEFGFDKGFALYKESEGGVDVSVDQSLRLLERYKEHKFFLFLHTFEVHAPYTHDYYIKKDNQENADIKTTQIAAYDSGIRYTDEHIKRLVDWLKENHLYNDTVIIITSDHGEHFDYEHEGLPGTHGYTLEDFETLVPMIIGGAAPFAGGKEFTSQVSAVDILPTILEAAGIDAQGQIRGRSMYRLLEDPDIQERLAYTEATPAFVNEMKSIRNSKYKMTSEEIVDKEKKTNIVEYNFFDMNKNEKKIVNLSDIERRMFNNFKSQLINIIVSIKKNGMKLSNKNVEGREISSNLQEQLKALGYLQ